MRGDEAKEFGSGRKISAFKAEGRGFNPDLQRRLFQNSWAKLHLIFTTKFRVCEIPDSHWASR